MDKIILTGMKFYGYHGCLPEERQQGQPFFVDLDISVNLEKAGKTDCLSDTINYSIIFDKVRAIVEGPPFQLIEKVAAVIAETLLEEFSEVAAVRVTLHKPHAPIRGAFQDVAVVIERARA